MARRNPKPSASTSETPKSAWEVVVGVVHSRLGNRGVSALLIVVAVPSLLLGIYKLADEMLEHFSRGPTEWMAANAAATSEITLYVFMPHDVRAETSYTSVGISSDDPCTLRVSETHQMSFPSYITKGATNTTKSEFVYSIPLRAPFRTGVVPWHHDWQTDEMDGKTFSMDVDPQLIQFVFKEQIGRAHV